MFTGRLASVLLFVLSLGFLVYAAPSPMYSHSKAVSARGEGGRLAPLSALEGSLRKQYDSCMRVKTVDEAKVVINTVTSQIQTCNAALAQSGGLELDDHGKTDVALRVASVITLVVKIFFKLTQQLGKDAVASLLASVAVALKTLLSTVGHCVDGIFPLVLKKIADIKVEAVLKNDLVECAKLLGLAA
ncbi:hypothetical protein B0J17DRAFT_677060 [Rhizoctonia solani]|nr:hypothetical protein B0J17DRAFT_677060 [Rhizoctonia solani]